MVGLMKNHAYSLLDASVVTDHAGDAIRLLKIRNPHGNSRKGKWQGDWSDGSPLWTPDLRRQAGAAPAAKDQSGTFFMDVGDFRQLFENCTICRVRSNWHEARRPFCLPCDDYPCMGFLLEASETTECCVSICQPEQRTRQGAIYGEDLGPLACAGFVLVPFGGGELTPGKAAAVAHMRCRAVVSADCFLQAGQRYLAVPLSLHKGSSVPTVFACVSSRLVALKERQLSRSEARAAWASYAMSGKDKSDHFHGAVLHTCKATGGSVVAFAEHRGRGYFNVELGYSGSLCFSRGVPGTSDWLPSGFGQLLQVAVPDTASGGNTGWTSSSRYSVKFFPPSQWHEPAVGSDEHALHAPFRLPEE